MNKINIEKIFELLAENKWDKQKTIEQFQNL